MKKKILLIFENSGIKHILDSETNNESLIIAGDKAIQEKITNLGYTCKLINDYSKNPKNEIDKAIEWIKKWPDKSVLNGKSFKDILVYDDLSIFWFLENRFYLYKIQSLIPLIEQIKNMINTENPTDIFIKGNRDVYHIINRKYKNLFDNIQFISEEKNYIKSRSSNYDNRDTPYL